MFQSPSLITRIGIGKAIGFLIGLIAFVGMPYLFPDTSWLLRWGVLLWYTTLGAIVGVFGVLTYHPGLNLPLPWWYRAPLIGAWMNFVLLFFVLDVLQNMMFHLFGETGAIFTPIGFVFEGALAGGLMGWLATRFGGEGKKTVGR